MDDGELESHDISFSGSKVTAVISHAVRETPSRPGQRAGTTRELQYRLTGQQVQNMSREVVARHQTRISIRLSVRVQYRSETRSRSAIDFIAFAETALDETGGGSKGLFFRTLRHFSQATGLT